MKLLKLLPIILLALIMSAGVSSQNKNDLIKTIRANFQAINTDSTLKIFSLENEEFLENNPDGGGKLTGYYKNGSLVKIVEWIGISYGNRTREFYFMQDNLFFVYEKFESFIVNTRTSEMDHSKTQTSFEGRYYFNNEKIIDRKMSGKRSFEEDNVNITEELSNAAKENQQLLIRKRKAGR